MKIAHIVLGALGASQVYNIDIQDDPTTPDDFAKIRYESERTITWEEYSAKYPIVEAARGVKFLRFERNKLLAETDWIMTIDNYQTLSNKEEWSNYRQALRDITANPPPYVWTELGGLDIAKMRMPIKPKVIRTS